MCRNCSTCAHRIEISIQIEVKLSADGHSLKQLFDTGRNKELVSSQTECIHILAVLIKLFLNFQQLLKSLKFLFLAKRAFNELYFTRIT